MPRTSASPEYRLARPPIMMNTTFTREPRRLAALLLAAGVALGTARAEDIDLYVAGSANSAPNVLFLLDNTSNWSNNAQAWNKSDVLAKCGTDSTCQRYVATVFGNASSLTQGQVEVRALKLVVNELVCTNTSPLNVNVGLMLLSANKGSISGSDNSWVGSWMLQAVGPLSNGGQCNALSSKLDAIDQNITDPKWKAASNANYGGAMFEVFKYFGGYAGPSGVSPGTPVRIDAFGPDRYTAAYAEEDRQAFTDGSKTTYQSPIANACGKNYMVLVGNTFPNLEVESTSGGSKYDKMLRNLGYASTGQIAAPKTGSTMRYADEWAQFLATSDTSNQPGRQGVVSYAIDVYNSKPDAAQGQLLLNIATYGGSGSGGYFKVGGDLRQLINAFKEIFVQVAAVNSVFASASLPVSVNTQGTFLNQVFVGMFRPDPEARPRWAGNIKQYQFALNSNGGLYLADATGVAAIDNGSTGFISSCRSSFWTTDSGSYWASVPQDQTPLNACSSASTLPTSDLPDGEIVEKGGAAQIQRQANPANRIVNTCANLACSETSAGKTNFNLSSATTLASALGTTTPSQALVDWIRGMNTGDGDGGGVYQLYPPIVSTATRPTVHGDVVHARPLAVNYGSGSTNDVVLYYGAGDGLLHAINGSQTGTSAGLEQWSFLAPEFLPRMTRLRENTPKIAHPNVPQPVAPKDYFFDGGITAYQERGTTSKVYLFAAMRRGGRQIYAFDASSRPDATKPATLPSVLWKFGCPHLGDDTGCSTGATAIGQTWSQPHALRIKGDSRVFLIFGGGYDGCEDSDSCSSASKGRGLFVLDAATGALVTYIDLGSAAGRVMADPVPVDINGDGFADLIYTTDTLGNVWRTNIADPTLGGSFDGYAPANWANRTYRIATVADATDASQHRKIQYAPDVVLLGGTANLFFGTGDREKPLPGSSATKVRNRFYGLRDNFEVGGSTANATAPTLIDGRNCDGPNDTTLDTGCQVLNVTDLTKDYSTAMNNPLVKGWLIDLSSTSEPYEQVITMPVTTGGYVYFSTYQARANSTASSSCSNLGTARGYAVNFLTGSTRKGDNTREAEFVGGGLPPSPVAGLVEIGGKKVPFILGGRQIGSGSALEGSKVPVDISTVRKKVYRYQKID
jgi:type IV pilus assembly protein PilY1